MKIVILFIGIASFYAELLEWQGFWDRFQASIHNNDSLPNIDIFNYSKDNLKGEALAAILKIINRQ